MKITRVRNHLYIWTKNYVHIFWFWGYFRARALNKKFKPKVELPREDLPLKVKTSTMYDIERL